MGEKGDNCVCPPFFLQKGAALEESMFRRVIHWAVEISTVVALAWFLVYSVGTHTVNAGQSMRPVLEDGDELLLNRVAVTLFRPKRFDIVLFRSEESRGQNIKRIIGLPGEEVQIQDGVLRIDGEVLKEPEGLSGEPIAISGRAEKVIRLGEEEYFVLSDNRSAGQDSRFDSVGNVKKERMVGTVWFRIGPFSKIGTVR